MRDKRARHSWLVTRMVLKPTWLRITTTTACGYLLAVKTIPFPAQFMADTYLRCT